MNTMAEAEIAHTNQSTRTLLLVVMLASGVAVASPLAARRPSPNEPLSHLPSARLHSR